VIGSSDDFDLETGADFAGRVAKNRPLIGAVGKQLLEKRKPIAQRLQQCDAAIAILNTGRMNDSLQ